MKPEKCLSSSTANNAIYANRYRVCKTIRKKESSDYASPREEIRRQIKEEEEQAVLSMPKIPQSLHDLLEMIAVLRGETKDDTTIQALRIGTKKLKRQIGIKTLQ